MEPSKRQIWDNKEVRTLLTIITEKHRYKLLDKQIKRNAFIYREIVRDMRDKGYRKSTAQVRRKFKQMKKGFLAIVRHNELRKADRHTMDNFDLLKEIFKYHPSMLEGPQDDSTSNSSLTSLEKIDPEKQKKRCTKDDEAPQKLEETVQLEGKDPLNWGEQDDLGPTVEILESTINTATLLRNAIRVEASADVVDISDTEEDISEPKRKRCVNPNCKKLSNNSPKDNFAELSEKAQKDVIEVIRMRDEKLLHYLKEQNKMQEEMVAHILEKYRQKKAELLSTIISQQRSHLHVPTISKKSSF